MLCCVCRSVGNECPRRQHPPSPVLPTPTQPSRAASRGDQLLSQIILPDSVSQWTPSLHNTINGAGASHEVMGVGAVLETRKTQKVEGAGAGLVTLKARCCGCRARNAESSVCGGCGCRARRWVDWQGRWCSDGRSVLRRNDTSVHYKQLSALSLISTRSLQC